MRVVLVSAAAAARDAGLREELGAFALAHADAADVVDEAISQGEREGLSAVEVADLVHGLVASEPEYGPRRCPMCRAEVLPIQGGTPAEREGTPREGERCPQCGGVVVEGEGAKVCVSNCGWGRYTTGPADRTATRRRRRPYSGRYSRSTPDSSLAARAGNAAPPGRDQARAWTTVGTTEV